MKALKVSPRTVTWGEIVNRIRTLHLEFYKNFPYTYEDIELKTQFYYPPSQGISADWDPTDWQINDVPEHLSEIIELNPVERILLEGPLSPNEVISIHTETEVGFLFKQILMLEREWLAQMRLVRPETQTFTEKHLKAVLNEF